MTLPVSFLNTPVLIFLSVLLYIIYFISKNLPFWSVVSVCGPSPNLPYSHILGLIFRKRTNLQLWSTFYNNLKKCGLELQKCVSFSRPIYTVIDPELLKNIMTKDFNSFQDRGLYWDEDGDTLTLNLVNIKGDKWKNLRSRLTPTFSSGKLKKMFHILAKVSERMCDVVDADSIKHEDIDIKETLSRYTSDVFANCAFGLECNSLQNPADSFYAKTKEFMDIKPLAPLKMMIAVSFPNWFRKIGIRLIPQDYSDFLSHIVQQVIDLRRSSNQERHDFMQILINLMNTPGENSVTFNEILAQAGVFILGGYESSANAISFSLYELANNQNVQDKLRLYLEEIQDVNGNFQYDSLMELPYLDHVVSEALRMYPPLPFTIRECVKNYVVPSVGEKIPEGSQIIIPIYLIHRDPQYFPNPNKFEPLRHTEENKKSRHSYSYMPFGQGPRSCIGMRFALMQVKIGIAQLISRYRFSVSKNTALPIQLEEKNLTITTKKPIYLKAEKVSS